MEYICYFCKCPLQRISFTDLFDTGRCDVCKTYHDFNKIKSTLDYLTNSYKGLLLMILKLTNQFLSQRHLFL